MADRKTKMVPWPLIGWEIFNFFSEIAEWNSMKLKRKQDLNVLYQVCVFWLITKMVTTVCPLIGWNIFDLFSAAPKHRTQRNMTLAGSKISMSSTKYMYVFFSSRSENQDGHPSGKLDRKQDLNVLYKVRVFMPILANRKAKDATLSSDRLRHFRV